MEPLERHAAAVERVKRWFALRGRTVSDDAVLRQALALYERLLAGVDEVAKASPRIVVEDDDDGEEGGGLDGGWSL